MDFGIAHFYTDITVSIGKEDIINPQWHSLHWLKQLHLQHIGVLFCLHTRCKTAPSQSHYGTGESILQSTFGRNNVDKLCGSGVVFSPSFSDIIGVRIIGWRYVMFNLNSTYILYRSMSDFLLACFQGLDGGRDYSGPIWWYGPHWHDSCGEKLLAPQLSQRPNSSYISRWTENSLCGQSGSEGLLWTVQSVYLELNWTDPCCSWLSKTMPHGDGSHVVQQQ